MYDIYISHLQFKELRDTGLPDTGPKRPKNKRVIPLTPATVTNSTSSKLATTVVNETGSVKKKGHVQDGGSVRVNKKGKRRRESGNRSKSLTDNTPQTQLRADINDLISSKSQYIQTCT